MNRISHTLELLNSDIPGEGIHVEVMEIITGFKGLGSIEMARNRLDPYIDLFSNQIRINAYKQVLVSYGQVERLVFLPNKHSPYAIRVYLKQSKYTYSFTILDQDLLVKIFDYISARLITS
ncbi:MAG: hypothetical protein GYA18_11260 [Chloroflexi bacterium]|nr:hypothetical protein [Chloroflexota bacterium]